MNKQQFDELVKRLIYWNKAKKGVKSHITANPVFTVQEKVRVYGMDADYSDKIILVDDDANEWENPDEFYAGLDEEGQAKILAQVGVVSSLYFDSLNEENQLEILHDCGYDDLRIVYYKEEWKHVNTHLTREGAQAFIARKKHDHGELRIYVESLYWCVEFKELIEAIVDGNVVYTEVTA